MCMAKLNWLVISPSDPHKILNKELGQSQSQNDLYYPYTTMYKGTTK